MSLLADFTQRADRCGKRWLSALSLLLCLLCLLSLCAGEQWFFPSQWLSAPGKLFVLQIRLPRMLAVMVVGSALAVTGAVMQALFENPLAEPGLLGVSNGAGVGLVLCLLSGRGELWPMTLSAVAGALLVTMILLRFAYRHLSNSRLLLAGVALGMICSAAITWGFWLSSSLDLRQIIYWLMGGFSGVDWRFGWLMLALLLVLIWLVRQGEVVNLLSLGEIAAAQLGVSLRLWRSVLVLAMGWLAGGSVAMAGAIGFVGLVVPHLLRLCGLTDYRFLLPACGLSGAGVLLAADLVARLMVTSAELPTGVITATLGAPLFIWLLIRQRQ